MRTCRHCHNDTNVTIGGFCTRCLDNFNNGTDVMPENVDYDLTTCTTIAPGEMTDSERAEAIKESRSAERIYMILMGICPKCGDSSDVEFLEAYGFCRSCDAEIDRDFIPYNPQDED